MASIDELKNTRVLVVGDCMIDRYWWGNVERISPEAPVPVVQLSRTSVVAGGAANVAANVAGLGAEPILIGVCGSDAEAEILANAVVESGVSAEHLIATDDRPTITKTRIVAHGQHVVRIDQESIKPIDPKTEDEVISKIRSAITTCRAIILSDYAKGVLTDRVVRSVIELAREHNIRCFVDPKGRDYSKYRSASVITPNRLEAAAASGLSFNDDDLVGHAGSSLLADLACEAVLITEGENGMTLFGEDGTSTHLDSVAREVFDVTGAGDTVIATFATAAASGFDLGKAAMLANVAAGIVVGTVGTTTITHDDLKNALLDTEEK